MDGVVELRPYQQEAIDSVRNEWAAGNTSTLLVLATGTGKTVIFSDIARRCAEKGNRTLVIAHRSELIDQAAAKLSALGVPTSVEQANRHFDPDSMAVVASVQTLQGDRLERFPLTDFATVIIDEAHHSVADSYRRIIDAHADNGGFLLGVTATADRADKRGLAEVYDSIAYEYPIARAVADGFLSPIKAKCLPLAIDITKVKVSHGDYQANELGSALDPYLPEIAKAMSEECSGRKTVCFLPLVSTAERMAEELNKAGLRAVAASGYDNAADRELKKEMFEHGDYDVLCNSMLYTEGWDCPAVDCIVVLRPTKSRGLYSQMVGRGTRLSPGKTELLLLDFLWMTEKHDLCRPASLLGKEQKVTQKMTDALESNAIDAEAADLFELAETATKDVKEERERKLAEELEKQRKKEKKLVDPLQFATSIQDLDLRDYTPTHLWEFEKPTAKQVALIERKGIDPASIDNAGIAGKLIDELIRRDKNKLSTPKQIRCLEQRGFKSVGTWTRQQASDVIAKYVSVGWKPWKVNIDPNTYDPRRGDVA